MGRNGSGKRSGATRVRRSNKVVAVDLFCGVGGLTRGLEKSGIDVRLGVDIDPNCEYPYTANNGAKFLLKSVTDLKAADLSRGKKKAASVDCRASRPVASTPATRYISRVSSRTSTSKLMTEPITNDLEQSGL
jgi:hypothetical protein